jgi:hypothetical protein
MADTIQTEQSVPVAGKTVIGMQGLKNPTPLWLTWIFRIEFILNKAVFIFFVSDLTVLQVKLLVCFDFIVWGIGRFVGVKKDEFENEMK